MGQINTTDPWDWEFAVLKIPFVWSKQTKRMEGIEAPENPSKQYIHDWGNARERKVKKPQFLKFNADFDIIHVLFINNAFKVIIFIKNRK